MNKQQEYIQKIEAISLVQIQVANLVLKKNKEYKPGYRYNVGKFEIHDERNVLLNEIVFDFDWSSYVKNYAKAKLVVEALENRKIPHYIYATGGKGLHIHVFFNMLKTESKEHKELLRNAASYGFIPKHIRLWFWKLILEEAGIEDIFHGKYVDEKVIKFNYYAGTSHLIRDCGGRKIKLKTDETYETKYKTYLSKEDFSKKKISVKEFENVKFPDELIAFDIDIYELSTYLKNFIKIAQDKDEQPLKNQYLKINYREIDGVLKIREGTELGNRGMGAFIISVACKIDRLSKANTFALLEDYVSKCSQSGHRFNISEAEQWMDWVYSQETVFWNCSQLKDLDVHDDAICEFCLSKNKKSLELLKSTTLIKKIQEVFSTEIVGEVKSSMLLFLLILTKDFSKDDDQKLLGDDTPQNIILASDSSSGKSYVAKRILNMFGDEGEDYKIFSRLTKSSLNYFKDDMTGKIIFVEEMQGADEVTEQLRVWMSEGLISLMTVEDVKQPDGTVVKANVIIKTKGQPVFMTCQAEGDIGDQLLNRCWPLSMDLSQSQTSQILEYQDKINNTIVKKNVIGIREIKEMLKCLKNDFHIKIPFCDKDVFNIPDVDVRSRRDYTKFLTLIKSVTHLHQYQRKCVTIDGNKYLLADFEDYNIAKELSQNILGATFTGLTIAQIDILNIIKNSSFSDEFTVSDIQRNTNKSYDHTYKQLKHLENLGFIMSDNAQNKAAIYSININKAVKIINLPSQKELETNEKIIKKIQYWEQYFDSANLENGDCAKKDISREKNENPENIENSHNIESENRQNSQFVFKSDQKLPIQSETCGQGKIFTFPRKKSDKISDAKSSPETEIKIGRIDKIPTQENIIEYIKNNDQHIIPIVDIEEHFSQNIDSIIDVLKKTGIIFEPKAGRVMLL